jgi:hypothetical protein
MALSTKPLATRAAPAPSGKATGLAASANMGRAGERTNGAATKPVAMKVGRKTVKAAPDNMGRAAAKPAASNLNKAPSKPGVSNNLGRATSAAPAASNMSKAAPKPTGRRS